MMTQHDVTLQTLLPIQCVRGNIGCQLQDQVGLGFAQRQFGQFVSSSKSGFRGLILRDWLLDFQGTQVWPIGQGGLDGEENGVGGHTTFHFSSIIYYLIDH